MSYSYSSSANMDDLMATLGVGGIIAMVVVCLAVSIVSLIAMFKIFKKAGKPGWHAIIPILNVYDEFDIAWGNGIMFLLLLIPFVNFVIEIMLMVKLAKAFGKDTGFAIGLIFLPLIFFLILAFGSARYVGPNGIPKMGGYPQPPYGGQQPPYGGQQPPYGGQQPPYGGQQPPYDNNNTQYPYN
ncbi:MAG: hypothetical protein IJK02_09745 [Clostridia bacterium]|nr:hypothetical protein [Clostridia bacterium]